MYEIFEKLLKERGLRVADVTRATGISSSTFTDWKKGRYVPKTDKLQKVADYFGVSLDYLIKTSDGIDIVVERYPKESWTPTITVKEEKDIEKRASGFIESLGNDTGLMFNGQPIDDETRALFQNALEVAMKTASLAAKEKFTPNKYKK